MIRLIVNTFFLYAGHTYNLFAFPTECNFSGVRFNLDLIDMIKEDSERILGGSQHSRCEIYFLEYVIKILNKHYI